MTEPITIATKFHEPSFREAVFEYARPHNTSPTIPERFKRALSVAVGGAVFGVSVYLVMLGLTNLLDETLGATHMFAAALGIFCTVAAWSIHSAKMASKVMDLAAQSAMDLDPSTFTFDADGIRHVTRHSTNQIMWPAVFAVKVRDHATVILIGPAAYAIPHHDLPDGMTPEIFAQQLNDWKSA